MILRLAIKGKRVSLPVSAIDENGQGWTIAPAPESGIVFVFNAKEAIQGGSFIEEKRLRQMLAEINRQKKAQKESRKNGK